MVLPEKIISMIKTASGVDINSPKAFYALSLDIRQVTGDVISENTLRRLLCVLGDDRVPHKHTLDIIGRYLGFSDWRTLIDHLDPSDSNFVNDIVSVLPSNLQPGQTVVFCYEPDRKIIMKFIGGNSFEVISGGTSKLQAGDILECGALILHFPFIATKVTRDGEELGQYMSAEAFGLSSIEVS